MTRPVILVTLAVIRLGLILFGLSDAAMSVANISVPHNQAANSLTKASNSSASATITITVYAVDEE